MALLALLMAAVLSLRLASRAFWAIYNFLWPDALSSYDQSIKRAYNERLVLHHRIEERQLSEIHQRLQNGQRLSDQINRDSALIKVSNSVDECIIRVFIARDLCPRSVFGPRWLPQQLDRSPQALDKFRQAVDDAGNQIGVVRSDHADAEEAVNERENQLARLSVAPDYQPPTEGEEGDPTEIPGH